MPIPRAGRLSKEHSRKNQENEVFCFEVSGMLRRPAARGWRHDKSHAENTSILRSKREQVVMLYSFECPKGDSTEP